MDDDGGGELKVGGWGPSNWISSRKLGKFPVEEAGCEETESIEGEKEEGVFGVLGFFGDVSILCEEVA